MTGVTDPPTLRDRLAKAIHDSFGRGEGPSDMADRVIAILDAEPERDCPACGATTRQRMALRRSTDTVPMAWPQQHQAGLDLEVLNTFRKLGEEIGLHGAPRPEPARNHKNTQAECVRSTHCPAGTWSGDHLRDCPTGDRIADAERRSLSHHPCALSGPHTPHAHVDPPESRVGGRDGYRRAWCNGDGHTPQPSTQGMLADAAETSDPTPGGAPQAQPEGGPGVRVRPFPGMALECSSCGATTPKDQGEPNHFGHCPSLQRTFPLTVGDLDYIRKPPLRFTLGADAKAGMTLTTDPRTGYLVPLETPPTHTGWWCVTCGGWRGTEAPRPEERCATCGTTSCASGGDTLKRSTEKRTRWAEREGALPPDGPGAVEQSDTTTTTEDA